jgi:hypothetical protein
MESGSWGKLDVLAHSLSRKAGDDTGWTDENGFFLLRRNRISKLTAI